MILSTLPSSFAVAGSNHAAVGVLREVKVRREYSRGWEREGAKPDKGNIQGYFWDAHRQ
jgi:hypothetical protein